MQPSCGALTSPSSLLGRPAGWLCNKKTSLLLAAAGLGGSSGLSSSARTYEPVATADTTDPRYWLHWRVGVCALWVLACVAVAACLLWRREGPGPGAGRGRPSAAGAAAAGDRPEGACRGRRPRPAGALLYADEAWRPCLRDVHPAWLLAYRLVSFFVLLSLLAVVVISDGGRIFYYYTQWTFTLVTIYFGLATALSVHGCSKFAAAENAVDAASTDTELGTTTDCDGARGGGASAGTSTTKPSSEEEEEEEVDAARVREAAGFWGYLLQIIYQTNAGAVMLTDCVFWFVIFPFLTVKDYSLNSLLVGMHSVNAVFLLGEAALNSLRFPWFRIAYLFLWTALYVIFQWVVHAATPIWWPYPFLDLSSNFSPLWYLAVAVMQVPCYVVFRLVIGLKRRLLLKWFPAAGSSSFVVVRG